ncbi:hypothetical protein ACH5RR_015713 [Cinchona calisaya]|uniref:Uncharacterized protein n=1 Tax=Cinchona calisaya TaxID=153742 RepID=A0ABD2ZTY1_9GENT
MPKELSKNRAIILAEEKPHGQKAFLDASPEHKTVHQHKLQHEPEHQAVQHHIPQPLLGSSSGITTQEKVTIPTYQLATTMLELGNLEKPQKLPNVLRPICDDHHHTFRIKGNPRPPLKECEIMDTLLDLEDVTGTLGISDRDEPRICGGDFNIISNISTFDHSPLLLSIGIDGLQVPKLFRFQQTWLQHPTFLEDVKSCWDWPINSMGMRALSEKLKSLKIHPREWNHRIFDNIFDGINKVETVVDRQQQV